MSNNNPSQKKSKDKDTSSQILLRNDGSSRRRSRDRERANSGAPRGTWYRSPGRDVYQNTGGAILVQRDPRPESERERERRLRAEAEQHALAAEREALYRQQLAEWKAEQEEDDNDFSEVDEETEQSLKKEER